MHPSSVSQPNGRESILAGRLHGKSMGKYLEDQLVQKWGVFKPLVNGITLQVLGWMTLMVTLIHAIVTCKTEDLFNDHRGMSLSCSGSSMQKL